MLRLILQTIYVLKREILHFLSSKSAAYKQERLQIESGLRWRVYGRLMKEANNSFVYKLSILVLCTSSNVSVVHGECIFEIVQCRTYIQ